MKFTDIHIPGAGRFRTVVLGRRYSPELKAMETTKVTGPAGLQTDAQSTNQAPDYNPPETGEK